MDPFARKMILGSLVYGAAMLLLAGALSVVYFHNRPRCSERVLSEATSPNRQWTAEVMERRCGEDSPFILHVNLRPAAEPVRLGYFSGQADDGEVFAVEEDTQPAALALDWVSSTQLTIRCPRCRPAPKLSESWGPVHVSYEGGR
jgi:hypothetical protein